MDTKKLIANGQQPTAKNQTKTLIEKTVTLTVHDWTILCATLELTAANVGRLGIPSDAVGNVHKNATTLIAAIEQQINNP